MARKYDHEYNVQAVKLAKEISDAKAAKEPGIPEGFHSDAPLKKCITDITEIPASDGAYTGKHQTAYPALEGTINHSDRGTQYTSEACRQTIRKHHIHQSTNSAGGRCHENARCESMWARMKTEFPQLLK